MSPIYQAIRPRKVSDEIVDQIKALISDGQLKPGEKLPNERDFSELLGVGRSSLREAITSLATQGYIEVRKRQGVFVRSLSARITYDPLRQLLKDDITKIFSLYELRKDIEMAAAFRAAVARDPKAVAMLNDILMAMRDPTNTRKKTLDHDLNFHVALAGMTGNILRVSVLKDLLELHQEAVGAAHDKIVQDSANVATLFAQHQAVFDAIQSGRPEAAREAMGTHLTWVEEQCRRCLENHDA